MYFLYLDESGQHHGRHFVLAGIAVFERQTFWLAQQLDRIQEQIFPESTEPIEFHASQLRGSNKPPWNQLSNRKRRETLDAIYNVIAESDSTLFGIVVEREHLRPEDGDEYSFAFENIVKRFDRFLVRYYKNTGDPQRGLIIIAESEFRQRIEALARTIKRLGTRWGELYNQAEVPMFTPALNSRLLQIADFCANAIFGRYESGYTRHFDKLVPKFDRDPETEIIHGLFHYCHDHLNCYCPACLSRRKGSASLGP